MIGAALQTAIYAALSQAPAIAGGRVYDRVPESAAYPRITIGDEQVLDDGNSCDEGWEVFSDVHIWSRPAAGSKVEAKNLAASVTERVVSTDLAVAGYRVIIASLENQRSMRDPDGITEHTVLTVRHVLEPT